MSWKLRKADSENLCKMAGSLLQDMPATTLQAVLSCLSPHDHGSLRLVNHLMSQLIVRHVPYISLLLSDTTSNEQLYNWCQATEQLHHVSNIHLYIAGEVPADVFDQALRLLAKHFSIRELQLLAVPDSRSSECNECLSNSSRRSKASLSTLQPVTTLLNAGLQSLVVKDVEVQYPMRDGTEQELIRSSHMSAQLAAAAPSAGWQLQKLSIDAAGDVQGWKWFSATLLDITKAFPHLQHVKISLPVSWFAQYKNLSSVVMLPEATVVAGLANAVLRLHSLEVLRVTGIPDIWRGKMQTPLSVDEAAEADGLAGCGLTLSSIPSVVAATPLHGTLDDLGCWLLQQHPRLQTLHIGIVMGWGISWRQRQQQSSCNSFSLAQGAEPAGAPPLLTDVVMSCSERIFKDSVDTQSELLQYTGDSDACYTVAIDSNQNWLMPQSGLTELLKQHSHRPAMLLQHISSCHVDLKYSQNEHLAVSFGALRALKHLEISLWCSSPIPSAEDESKAQLEACLVAAAAVQGIQSIAVDVNCKQLNDDMLLPLTAAAGGPGSSLKRLQLLGGFVGDFWAAAAAEDACATASKALIQSTNQHTTLQGAAPATAAMEPAPMVKSALCQLDGLHELILQGSQLSLPVECLPAGLKVLRGSGLNISSCAGVVVTSGLNDDGAGDVFNACKAAGGSGPCLVVLYLKNCQISSPSILASNQLQQLTVIRTTWSGGWTAAAAAWPAVRELKWHYNEHLQLDSKAQTSKRSHSNSKGEWSQDAWLALLGRIKVHMPLMLHEMSVGFSNLRSLTMLYLPWISQEVLQPVAQQLKTVQYLYFAVCSRPYTAAAAIVTQGGHEPHNIQHTGSSVEVNFSSDIHALEQWLQQQLPWACVCIAKI